MNRNTSKVGSAVFSISLLLAFSNYVSAGSVTILNCSNADRAQVASYNGNDAVRFIAYNSTCMGGRGQSATLNCATSTCIIKLWPSTCIGGPTGFSTSSPLSGRQIYYNSQLYPETVAIQNGIKGGILSADTKSLDCNLVDKLAPLMR